MSITVKYVGLDVHKSTIALAVAEAGKRAEAREHGEIPNTPAALTKLLAKLAGSDVELNVCYEAGPCGYGIQRKVAAAGYNCAVVAPSLIPSRPGDRIKTDPRDAAMLAWLHRAGELTSVWVLTELMRRCATWSGFAWLLYAACATPGSNCPAFCFVMVITITAPHGHRCIVAGCPGFASPEMCIILYWKTT